MEPPSSIYSLCSKSLLDASEWQNLGYMPASDLQGRQNVIWEEAGRQIRAHRAKMRLISKVKSEHKH